MAIGPMCPGSATKVPHAIAELAFRDEFARDTKDNTAQAPIRVIYCPDCGHVFSVAPRAVR